MSVEKIRWEFGDLVISRARKIDAMSLLSIHREVLAEGSFFITRGDECRRTLVDQPARIHSCLDSPGELFLVARVRRMPVGFLVLEAGPLARMRHCLKLELMVAQAARGQGIGKRLLAAAVEWARATSSVEKVGLNVFADNEKAVQLYRSFGFTEEGRRHREYRLEDGRYRDDLLMQLWVGDSA